MKAVAKFLFFQALVVGCVVLSTAPASASLPYLTVVQELGWPGQCELCHVTVFGEATNANKPFADSLRSAANGESIPLGTGDTEGLRTVLAALGNRDADGDGIEDVTEIELQSDPNDPGCAAAGCLQPYDGARPEYGCAVRSTPQTPRVDPVAGVPALLVACGLLLHRPRRRRRQGPRGWR